MRELARELVEAGRMIGSLAERLRETQATLDRVDRARQEAERRVTSTEQWAERDRLLAGIADRDRKIQELQDRLDGGARQQKVLTDELAATQDEIDQWSKRYDAKMADRKMREIARQMEGL